MKARWDRAIQKTAEDTARREKQERQMAEQQRRSWEDSVTLQRKLADVSARAAAQDKRVHDIDRKQSLVRREEEDAGSSGPRGPELSAPHHSPEKH